MNAKKAREIDSKPVEYQPMTEAWSNAFARKAYAAGFLEAVEKFGPMVEALEMMMQLCQGMMLPAKFEKVNWAMQSYRRDVLGE